VDNETKRQIDELLVIREDHTRRQYALERKAAQLGQNTPPEIEIELEDITAAIAAIDSSVVKLHVAAARQVERALIGMDVAGEITRESTNERLGALGRYIMFVEDSLRIDLAGLYRLIESWHDTDSGVRKMRQRRLDLLLVVIILLAAATLAILVLAK
jgi:hypothetical protein